MIPRKSRFVAALSVGLAAACGSSGSAVAPSTPSTTTPVATPTPAATPGTSPTSGLPASCRAIPAGIGTPAGCRTEASDFLRAVTDAVNAAQNATVVDPDSKESYALIQGGVIQSPNAYLKLITDALDRQGLCAVYDGEELNVRNTAGFNEHFDVITSSGGSWIKYMSTCTPALPVPAITAPPVRDAECRLAPSRDSFCERVSPVYNSDVDVALDELIAQDRALAKPLIFDFNDRGPGLATGWKVTNVPLYFSELQKKLRARGLCSAVEGDDELWIKKGSNRFSEHWDLLKAEGYSLRLLAATCRDAAF